MTLRLSIQIDSSHYNFSRNWHTQRQVRRWHLSSISSCSLDRWKMCFFLVQKRPCLQKRRLDVENVSWYDEYDVSIFCWLQFMNDCFGPQLSEGCCLCHKKIHGSCKTSWLLQCNKGSNSPDGSLVRPWGQAKDIQQKNTVVTYVQDISMGHLAAKIAFKSWFLVMRMTMESKKWFRAWRVSIIWISFQRWFPLY